MTDEEILRKKLNRLNENSHYGIMTDNDMFDHISMIMNVDQAEIAKIIHSYIERGISCDHDRLNCPKPPIYIGPVKVKTLKERLEENKMKKATSVQNIKNVNGVSFSIENHPMEEESKLTIVASTNDDIFAFEFEGPDLLQSCKAAGLFTGLEKDQKIKELETKSKDISDDNALLLETNKELKKENKKLKEELHSLKNLKKSNLPETPITDTMLVDDYLKLTKEIEKLTIEKAMLKDENEKLDKELGEWKKEASDCLRVGNEVRREKNKEINELKHQLQQATNDKRRYEEKIKNLEQENKTKCENCLACPSLVDDYFKLAKKNEQLTFEKEMIKKGNDKLKKELALEKAANEAQHKFILEYAGKGTEVQFNYAIDDVKEVSYVVVDKEEYNKNFEKWLNAQVENAPASTSRADILDQAKKCVCGQREQDYGTPESNFQLIADLWNGYLGEKTDNPVISVTPVDVSMMMSLMKIARIRNGGGSGDSFVDLAGYAACGGEIWHGQKAKDQN